jgi:hypothetical protein
MATITKLSDDKFNGQHPNDINNGYTETINVEELPSIEVGVSYYFGSLRTSTVTEIISQTDDKIEFKTINSTYVVTK